jgi:hypothetical protein
LGGGYLGDVPADAVRRRHRRGVDRAALLARHQEAVALVVHLQPVQDGAAVHRVVRDVAEPLQVTLQLHLEVLVVGRLVRQVEQLEDLPVVDALVELVVEHLEVLEVPLQQPALVARRHLHHEPLGAVVVVGVLGMQRLLDVRLERDGQLGQLHPLVVEVGALLQLGKATGLRPRGRRPSGRLRYLHVSGVVRFRA